MRQELLRTQLGAAAARSRVRSLLARQAQVKEGRLGLAQGGQLEGWPRPDRRARSRPTTLMGGTPRAASTPPLKSGERPKSRTGELLDGIQSVMDAQERGGTPSGRVSLPELTPGAAGTPFANMISRLQAEYPDVNVNVPAWAEDEWTKDETRLYFETQGLVKPPRKKNADKRTTEAHKRLLDERLRRRLREASHLQAELGQRAVRPFAPSEVVEMVEQIDTMAESAEKNGGAIKNVRAQRVLRDVAKQLGEVGNTLREALTPAAFDEGRAVARRESSQLTAMSRRLTRADGAASLSEERNKELNEQLITTRSAIGQAQSQVMRLRSENAALKHKLVGAQRAQAKAEAKAKEGIEAGYRKADDAIAARVLHIMKVETDLREEQEKCRSIHLKMRKLKSKLTRLEREKADMRVFTDKNTSEHAALKRALNTAQLRERTYRNQNAWLREQLDETVDALLDPASGSVSDESVKSRLQEVYQQLLDVQAAYTDLSVGGPWQTDAAKRATPGGSPSAPGRQGSIRVSASQEGESDDPFGQDGDWEDGGEAENPFGTAITSDFPDPEPEEAAGAASPSSAVDDYADDEEEEEEEYVIHNAELRALVEELGGVGKVREMCSSSDPELRETALDAMKMIEADKDARTAEVRQHTHHTHPQPLCPHPMRCSRLAVSMCRLRGCLALTAPLACAAD